MDHKGFHKILADQGIRIFSLSLGTNHISLIHPNKTVSEWRSDVRTFISEIGNAHDEDGNADGKVFDALMVRFHDAGYFDVDDIASDVYEGRIAKYNAGIQDDPAHEEQSDGFGHYGWESKN